MALMIKDQNGNVSELAPSAIAVSLGHTQIGKEFEVAGGILSRTSEEIGGTAVLFVAEGPGLGSFWINDSYDPSRPGSGWKRTMNMQNGNVGIGKSGSIAESPTEKLVVAGNILVTGDVLLNGADCAEEFDIVEEQILEPGTVMVISHDEKLAQSTQAYDSRVAGVLSGAGECRPGILLGRRSSRRMRRALALTGKVFCKVDAQYSPVAVGDLLTTSPTVGHAMRACDPARAFGAILGKALRPLSNGQGLLPVLVALQ